MRHRHAKEVRDERPVICRPARSPAVVADAFGLRARYLLGNITIAVAAAAALPVPAQADSVSPHQAARSLS